MLRFQRFYQRFLTHLQAWPCLVVLILWSTSAHGSTAQKCNTLLSKKNYTSAGSCFKQLLAKLKPNAKLSLLEKKEKKLYLKKASYSFRKAGEQFAVKGSFGKASYYYSESKGFLQTIIKEKLCASSVRCNIVQGQIAKLDQRMPPANLTLIHSQPTLMEVKIEGFKYTKNLSLQRTQTLRVRAGSYVVTFGTKDKPKTKKEVFLKPNATKTLTLSRLVIVKRAPVAQVSRLGPLSVLGVGVGLLIIGTAGIVAGYLIQDEAVGEAQRQIEARSPAEMNPSDYADAVREAPNWASSTNTIDNNYTTGTILLSAGWGAAGLGIATSIGGAIWLLTQPATKPVFTRKRRTSMIQPQTDSQTQTSQSFIIRDH